MPWAAIEKFHQWADKRKRLLKGLLGLAVEGVADCVPGGALAVWTTRIVGEFAKYGVERLADPKSNVPDVKPAGQSISAEQLEQFNDWLASLSASYAGLLDRLDTLVTPRDGESDEQLQAQIRQALSQHADLAREFGAHAEETRRQTLSLARIEERLDKIYHGQKGIDLSLEEIKALLLQCAASWGEWEQLRQARPDAVRLLVEADEHFLAGRREEGMKVLLRLFEQRGVGQATLYRRLGGACLGAGNLKEASRCLQQVAGPDGRPPAAVTRTLTSLASSTTRGSQLPAWRSLPRGFVIQDSWRIVSEVGRGGMASVYRAEGIDDVNRGQIVAIKVPAPGLLDAASRQRFVQEIQDSQKLSSRPHAAIVKTLGYVRLTDPHSKQPLYGLVLEFIDGESLAQALALRQARDQSLSVPQIQIIMKSVCAALEHAHTQSPPIVHRDVKPPNVMVTRGGHVKLMDFGVARVLEDRRQTVTGGVTGTPVYMPPEFHDPSRPPDVRSDVYLAANLLVELLTFNPHGDFEGRSDCPKGWVELIGDAMNRVMSRRPASIREFREHLAAAVSEKGEEPPRKTTGTPQTPRPPQTAPERKQAAQQEEREIINSIGMKLVLVKPGVFLMGSPPNEAERSDDEHQHEVEITHPFYAGIYPVTQEQYERVMGQNPSYFSANGGGKDKVKSMDTRQFPVESVTWDEAVKFCRRLSELPEEKENERLYRLPTEAEWEYICRGGPFFKKPSPPFYCGVGNSLSPAQANFDGNYPYGGAAKGTYLERPTKVGSYSPNPLELHDLHGNVWEWCADWFDAEYYKHSPRQDPQGPTNGERRVLRGGSWDGNGWSCRAACRLNVAPGDRGNYGGFRVVLVFGARTSVSA